MYGYHIITLALKSDGMGALNQHRSAINTGTSLVL
jgi:hypothetical protein